MKGIYVFSYFSIRGILVFFCGLWRCRKSVLGYIKNLSRFRNVRWVGPEKETL